jgi:hypothetical protein
MGWMSEREVLDFIVRKRWKAAAEYRLALPVSYAIAIVWLGAIPAQSGVTVAGIHGGGLWLVSGLVSLAFGLVLSSLTERHSLLDAEERAADNIWRQYISARDMSKEGYGATDMGDPMAVARDLRAVGLHRAAGRLTDWYAFDQSKQDDVETATRGQRWAVYKQLLGDRAQLSQWHD